MRERTFRGHLSAAVAAAQPRRVLELGAGTGSLTLRLAQALPRAELVTRQTDEMSTDQTRRFKRLTEAMPLAVERLVFRGRTTRRAPS